MKQLLNKKVKGIVATMLLVCAISFAQSNVKSDKHIYYERVYVFPATTKVDPTIYKKYELKEFKNDLDAVLNGNLTVGDFYSLPAVGGKSFIVKILKMPVLPTTKGSIENSTIYMSKEMKIN